MGQQFKSVTAELPFASLLAPVLGEVDDARIAVAAADILRADVVPEITVIPIEAAPVLTGASAYTVVGDPVQWHAVRLLIDQGKLPADARVPVRIFLNSAQWRRAGLIARIAEVANRITLPAMRRRRAAAREWSAHDLVRHL
jgi:hypothetical protein